jgi:hypothetical protein
MKTNLVFGILLLFLFSLGSCQKRRARNTLEGKWNVIGVQGAFIDQCSLDGEIVDARDTLLGELHFDRKEVSRAYVLMQGDPSCYLEAQRNDTKSWEVLDHERIVTAAHTYEIRIGDESWTVIFGENRIGEAARNQDVAYLAQLGGVGSALYIELERVN